MDNLIFSLNATMPIFLTMVVGYGLKQIKMLTDDFVKVLNKFNFTVTLPVMLFVDLAKCEFYEVWDTGFVMFCFLSTLFSIVSVWILGAIFLKDKRILGEFVQAAYRASNAVLGLAYITNIYGKSEMAPLMIIGSVPLYNVMAVVILTFTSPDQKQSNLNKKEAIKSSILGVLKNPIIISIVLGMVASILHIQFPHIIDKTMTNFASMASPLALVGLGAGFEGRKAIKMVKPTVICTIIKLMVWPALFIPMAYYFGFTGEKMVAILIMLGASSTPSGYIMAKNMGHDGVLTSSTVVLTTLFSSVSLTLWLYVLRCMGAI